MSSGRERLYAWDDKSLEWYVNAVEYGSFHRIVAEKMLKLLPEKPTVCDVGCGTGALALCLAEHCGNITAVDLNRKPIDYLKSTVRERGIEDVYKRQIYSSALSGQGLSCTRPETACPIWRGCCPASHL